MSAPGSTPDPDAPALSRRGAWLLLGLLTFALLGGALLAPWVFNALLWCGRAYPALDGLREIQFESLASRCVLLLLVAGLLASARLAGFRRLRDLGFAPGFWPAFARGFALGVASLLSLLLLGWALGAYVPNVEPRMTRPGALAMMLAGAVTVGILEEMIFRGFIHRVLRASWWPWAAVFFSSLFFSAVHFAKPRPDIGVVHGRWDSGLEMLPHMFDVSIPLHHYFPYAPTLFIMGVVLALRLQRAGWRLAHPAGLHGGWVLVMLCWGYSFDRPEGQPWWTLYGASDVVAKSPAALLLALAFLAWEGRVRRAARRPAPPPRVTDSPTGA